MKEPCFIETIKVVDGKFLNLPYHMERMNHTMTSFFNTTIFVELWMGDIPEELRSGITKCRVTYSYRFVNVEYERYHFRQIDSLKLIEDNTIDYSFKYADRSHINSLLEHKGNCDDILIIRNGYVTDTSYTNVVFENSSGLFTPTTYLLAGTKRKKLLEKGIVREVPVSLQDITKYDRIYLINAMIDPDDNISMNINDLL